MPQTIEGIKGEELLWIKAIRDQAAIDPDQVYYLTIYTEDEWRERADRLKKLAKGISI